MSNPDNPIVSVSYHNGAATVSWTATGVSAVSGYSVSVLPEGLTEVTDSKTLSYLFDDLEDNVEHTFTVIAINSEGYKSSGASICICPIPKHVTVSPEYLGFPQGVLIATPSGPVPVETLRTNQHVLLTDGRQVPVITTSKTFITTQDTAPYLIPKGVFGFPNDLMLSPLQAFQIKKGVWNMPKYVADSSVRQVSVGSTITYYQIECPNYLTDDLVINGCIVESSAARGLRRLVKYNKRLRLALLS
uniref:Fibronectin type-III domain-containing protein n=1 Tax=viral metagenome TaxID=1070528 RepID=A0A6C0DFH3_9ZZZZ